MGVGGILWGRRPARRAGRRQNPSLHSEGFRLQTVLHPPTPYPLSPLLKGGEGGSYTHVPCPFGALLVTLYQIFSKGFLNGKRDIGSGASPQRGLAPPKKKVYPGK